MFSANLEVEMIIDGNGLIASSIRKYSDVVDNAYVFARGVSNSSSQSEEGYQKEIHLLSRAIGICQLHSKKLVYFSSGGAIYGDTDALRKENMILKPISRYGQHKLECEKLIIESGVNYLILRLPNVIGAGGNMNQLFPYLISSVRQGRVKIYKNAVRDLIDVKDVSWIVAELLKSYNDNLIVNVASGIEVSVLDLVGEINKYIGNKLNIEIKRGGDKQVFSVKKLKGLLPELSFKHNYPYSLVGKYMTEIKDENI